MSAEFIHLRVHTSYSLSEGAIKIPDLVNLCRENKMPAVAVTDSGNLFGALEFSKTCSYAGIQPIIGCQMNINAGDGENLVLPLYAQNETGFRNLLKIVSNSFLGDAPCMLENIKPYAEGLLAMTGSLGRLLADGKGKKAEELLRSLAAIFPERLYVEISRHGMKWQIASEPLLLDMAYDNGLPIIAANDCYFATREMYEAHDALLCIAEGKYVVDENRRRLTPEHYFKSQEEMTALFADLPEAVQNTVVFAKRCAVKADERKPMLPHFPTTGGRSEAEELEFQAIEGLKGRLQGSDGPEYFERLKFELEVINKMNFPGYFLIVSDFIKWARNAGIPVGPGRGSGAGSVVAWSLQITDLDPLKFGLLFERFLNPERVSMPDFDIDFCQYRRDEVIDYVRAKYGNDRVAQIITFGKLQARAVLRDVGRVLQMPYPEVDRIAKMIPFNPVNPVTLSQAIEMDSVLKKAKDEDEVIGKLLDIGLKLEGLHRHASTHAAGIVIADRPLDELVPMYRDPKSDIPVIQYSMKEAEAAGLIKFDFLGLKTLTLIDKALQLIEQGGHKLNLQTLHLDDAETYRMLARGDTIGVFQLDSTLVRDAIRKMKPDKFEDIVALTSLCRPGPMENIPTYVARKSGQEKPDYPHPKLSEVLSETYGLMIYQEQVMQAAQVLAGYSLGSADLLRRAMGKKIKKEMDAQQEMFVEGAVKNGVERKQAAQIFELIAKFAGYGFNKSHAVAYALIAYHTAYIKAHYPVEFFAASMNLDIGDTDKLNFYRHEAARQGIKVVPPDVNYSSALFTVNLEKNSILYGLAAIKGAGDQAVAAIIEERERGGRFQDVFDLLKRVPPKAMNKKMLESLAKSGALDSIAHNRRQVVDSAESLVRFCQNAHEEKHNRQTSLFGDDFAGGAALPKLAHVPDWQGMERLSHEFEAVGFYLSSHPLEAHEETLAKLGVIPSNELEERLDKAVSKVVVAGVVATTKLRSGKRGRFGFAKISDAYGVFEIVMYDEDLISESMALLESNEPLVITAEARKDEGGIRLIAETIEHISKAEPKAGIPKRKPKDSALEIRVNSADSLEHIYESLQANLFAEHKPVRNRVSIIAELGVSGEAEVELAGFYSLPAESISALKVLPGVVGVREETG